MPTNMESSVSTVKEERLQHLKHNTMRQKTNYLTSKETQGIGVIELVLARFPHRSLLHYAYTPLFQEINSDNNTRPLRLWRFVLSF